MTKDGSCHGNGGTLEHFSVGPFPTTAPVITTSGPILGADGKSVAAPGTVVPRLADVPYPDGSVPDVSDRGVLPVVGYGVDTVSGGWNDGAKYLTVSYLVPVGPSISDYASSNYPAGGCRVDPVVSGLGTPTVTVNVKLSWSDAREHSDQENSACRAGGSKTRVMTSSWGKIADDTTILTDGPIADEGGVVVAGAAPGNRVPEKR